MASVGFLWPRASGTVLGLRYQEKPQEPHSFGEVTWLGMEYAIKVHFVQDAYLRTSSSCIVTDHRSNLLIDPVERARS